MIYVGTTDDTSHASTTFYSYSTRRCKSSVGILRKKLVITFSVTKDKTSCVCFCIELILTVTETWGDQDYCGLTGLEVVDINDADCVIHSFDSRPQRAANHVQTLDKYSFSNSFQQFFSNVSLFQIIR